MRLTDEELIGELKQRLETHKKTISDLEEMTAQLKDVNAKLNESEALKTHFISNMTNEIINPFASVLALSTEILQMKEADWDKVRYMTSLIHTETFYLDFQLRNIFAAAKIEAGEISPEISNIDLKELIRNTVDLFRIEAEKRNISIDCNCIPDYTTFKTDPARLKLILINLLSNSLKFSNENSSLLVDTSIKEKQLHLKIEDFGIGIPENFQKHVFDRFTRNDNTINSVVRGQGLGLSIVKAYVDILSGNIKIESQTGKGTTVFVSIPESYIDTNDFADGNEFIFDEDLVF